MTKTMTVQVNFKADEETVSKLNDLAKDSDKSKVLRALILFAWDIKNDSIRVPIEGKFGIHSGKSGPAFEGISIEEELDRR
jgi:hypothetical protein